VSTASRDNASKAPIDEVDWFLPALEEVSRVMQKGREKYPDDSPGIPNWTLGGKPDAEYLGAARRHMAKYKRGEIYDQEFGTHHLAHAVWNLLALLTLNWDDDRGAPEMQAMDEPVVRELIEPARSVRRRRVRVREQDNDGTSWLRGDGDLVKEFTLNGHDYVHVLLDGCDDHKRYHRSEITFL